MILTLWPTELLWYNCVGWELNPLSPGYEPDDFPFVLPAYCYALESNQATVGYEPSLNIQSTASYIIHLPYRPV